MMKDPLVDISDELDEGSENTGELSSRNSDGCGSFWRYKNMNQI